MEARQQAGEEKEIELSGSEVDETQRESQGLQGSDQEDGEEIAEDQLFEWADAKPVVSNPARPTSGNKCPRQAVSTSALPRESTGAATSSRQPVRTFINIRSFVYLYK